MNVINPTPLSNHLSNSLRYSRLISDSSSNNLKMNGQVPSPLVEPIKPEFCEANSTKTHVNENNNVTNGMGAATKDPLERLSLLPPDKGEKQVKKESQSPTLDDYEEDEDDEEDSISSNKSQELLQPILSAPTTIRFPAQTPRKERTQSGDSGICRWDKCEANFDSSSGLLEHLQVNNFNQFINN